MPYFRIGKITENTPEPQKGWVEVSTLPYEFCKGDAVVYNDEIHILGGMIDGTAHYKWNGLSWVQVSNMDKIEKEEEDDEDYYQYFNYGSAVVYNNEIHTLEQGHFKWNFVDGWHMLSEYSPINLMSGGAVVYNNEIHILGGTQDSTKHYKWDGTSWTSVSTLPYDFHNGDAVVYNNEIHIFGGYFEYDLHYKWNPIDGWTELPNMLNPYTDGDAVVYDGDILFFYGNYYDKWNPIDGSSTVSALPYDANCSSAVVYNNEIHILGGDGLNKTKHYKLVV